ncbi:ABC transporter substrate-binding protein [Vallitalea sediminicola]
MKKIYALLLVMVLVFSLAGCGEKKDGEETNKDTKKETVKLTFMENFQAYEPVTEALEEVVGDFMKEHPEIEIDYIPGTSDYEVILKTKMATNDLPDLWTTHGWSVARYSEYMMTLDDQSWVKDLHPAIKPVITDKDGHIYVLPMDVDISGIAYNKDVVEAAGVDVTKIINWEDMFDAMEKIKKSGVTPVHIGGKDQWTVGNFFDWVAPSMFITDEDNYLGDELKAGEFDIERWKIAAGLMTQLRDNEYLNVDALTSAFSDSARALAEGTAAFEFFGNYVISEALTYNPEANLGFFPVPAYYEGDEPSLISGERTAVGIWKDSKHPEEAKLFLDYLAKPEVVAKIATANSIPAGLTTATSDTGNLADSYELWKNVEAFPFFDREYLPSGMWDTMCSTGSGIIAGGMTKEEAANKMLEDFNKLYK